MPNSRFYSSIAAVTNLQVTANPGDTSIQVASSSGWPGSFPYIISLDYGAANEELVLVTSGGPTSFTVTRAYDGTSASTHNAGAVVRHVASAIDYTDSRSHEAATSAHGITGQFVDTLSVQTISNKTLTAPNVNNPTLGGTVTATGVTFTAGTFNSPTLSSPAITGGSVAGTISGTSTHSGTTTFTNGIAVSGLSSPFSRANTTDPAIRVKTDASGFSQLIVNADGSHAWGSGSGVGDVTLARTGAATLGVTGNLSVSSTLTASGSFITPLATVTTMAGNPDFTGQPTFTPITAVDAAVVPDTVTNGWSIDSIVARKAGGVTTIRVLVERVGGNITSTASGNIPDTKVGTLAAAWRPIDGTLVTSYVMSGIADGAVSIGNDGIITLKSLSAGNTISLADTVNFSLTFANSV